MNQLLSIVDDGLVIKKLSVEQLSGPTEVVDDFTVAGALYVNQDIKARKNMDVSGVLTADILKVKQLITEVESTKQDYTFRGRNEQALHNQGLTFVDDQGAKQFVYRQGNKLWSTMNIELDRDKSYFINGISVLTQTSLGSTVTSSNLQKVGKLKGLTVTGAVNIDDWVFFNDNLNRLGINTETPNGTLGIALPNAGEFIFDAKDSNAVMGTITSNGLDIMTDNKTRISIKSGGEINIGNEKFKNAVVKIHGKLEVDELITAGSDRGLLPIVFKTSAVSTIQGTGFLWQHANKNRQFIYNLDPDKIYSTETIDLHANKWYSIDDRMVLSRNTLGTTVTESYLEKLGTLRELSVNGPARFNSLEVDKIHVDYIENANEFGINVDFENEFKITKQGPITIGTDNNLQRSIKLNGQVDIAGAVTIEGKKIFYSSNSPSIGRYSAGDICFNQNPSARGYVGWVCTVSGTPGKWLPFGLILPD